MRNIFDQYDQAENKLTHALISTLYHERKLIRPFLKWLGIDNIPSLKNIDLGIQQLPGDESQSVPVKQNSVPDAYFCNSEDWAVIIESKVQAGVSINQLRRHQKKALRCGYEDSQVILITVNPPKKLPIGVSYILWKDVYKWFVARSQNYDWARHFVNYMQIFESKMLSQNYNIKGTITMFPGFQFDKETPYTYREGKRLIKVLGEEFRKNKRLRNGLGIDHNSEGRPAITCGADGSVWDFIRFKSAKGTAFTSYPHATFVIRPENACVAITIPNGVRGGVKNRLKESGIDGLADLLAEIEKNLRKTIKKAPESSPRIYAHQRYYKSQRSYPRTDGRIEADLRTLVECQNSELKHQPMWTEAIHAILTNKKTNIQFGIEVRFPFTAKYMQSEKAIDVMVDAWIAMKPLLDFIVK